MALVIIAYDGLQVEDTRTGFDLWWTHTNFKKWFLSSSAMRHTFNQLTRQFSCHHPCVIRKCRGACTRG
jgi:hypothetical protein